MPLQMGSTGPQLGLWSAVASPDPGPRRGHCGQSCMASGKSCPRKQSELALLLICCVTSSKSLMVRGCQLSPAPDLVHSA